MFHILREIVRSVIRPREVSGSTYWNNRAKRFGRRAVLNLAHTDHEYASVTDLQKRILYPLLSGQLNGHEKSVLDFGCGPGRFTADLANLIGGHATGVDICQPLLDLAPEAENVTYSTLDTFLHGPQREYDVIWVCLVLGGISNNDMPKIVDAIDTALSKDGLLFLVENVSDKADSRNWLFRSEAQYKAFFPNMDLRTLDQYTDCEEIISILAGRRHGY